jgi:hypothetical protein
MAFKDITKVLYDGTIKVDYKDSSHRYSIRERLTKEDGSFLLPADNPKAWSKVLKGVRGTTTLLGDTLEKKGLQRYPLTKALMYMFQFYEFTDENGDKKMGYSEKGFGSLWGEDGKLIPHTREEALEHISYGSKADLRWTQKGADIGSVVHDAIEHHVNGDDSFDLATEYRNSMEAAKYESDRAKEQAKAEFDADVAMAIEAFNSFKKWWATSGIELLGAEDLIYSRQYRISGTFDGLLRVPSKGVVLADWKTSNASQSKDACMLEGINYQYFLQSAIYAMAWQEMGNEKIDDLLIVSCRKDGGFTTIYASDLGLTVEDCINWAKAVIVCNRMMVRTKTALWDHGVENGAVKVFNKKEKK